MERSGHKLFILTDSDEKHFQEL